MRETTDMEAGMEWWRTVANVVELAYWLEERCELPAVADCIRLFDKPWHFDAEYQAMRAAERSAA